MDHTIRQIQLLELDILKEVVRICDENNLAYYMIGGTLLGAVRHQGFIPWDDDIDIAMPRPDYEQFMKAASKSLRFPYALRHFTLADSSSSKILRVANTLTEIIEISKKAAEIEVSIDIFSLDGVPKRLPFKKIYQFRVLAYRAIIGFCYPDQLGIVQKRSWYEKLLIKIAKTVPIGKLLCANNWKQRLDNLLKKQDYTRSTQVGSILGRYMMREVVPKEYFGEGTYLSFEGQLFRAPSLFDQYLTHMYGDYMQLPPESERIAHGIEIIDISRAIDKQDVAL